METKDLPEVGLQIEMKKDKDYYRVYLRFGTHILHSEKMNLATAIDIHHKLKLVVDGQNTMLEAIKKILEKIN